MKPLLRVSDLHLRFRLFEGVSHVLNGVSLEVGRGERVAVVGESGCGKSVTLRLIMGLVQQDNAQVDGTVEFDGLDMLRSPASKLRELRGRRICPIFQDPMASLNPTFTILDQMTAVIRRGDKARAKQEVYELAKNALKQVAITDPERVLGAYPFQLSGGLNQRVLIAMALVNQPDLVLADEPGTALDVTVQEQTLRLMRKLTEELNSAVLLITHNLGVVREFADRVYVMYAGSVVEEGSTRQIFSSPKHPYTQALMASVPKLSGGQLPLGIDGFVPDYTKPPPGCRFHPRCAQAREACTQAQPLRDLGGGHKAACVLYGEVGRA
ncbi:MAG: ABC transporter ATP-binding protein [Meiothermus sp.]|nr:ABC transporter ATP-binding protein [Meiothermus sp.]